MKNPTRATLCLQPAVRPGQQPITPPTNCNGSYTNGWAVQPAADIPQPPADKADGGGGGDSVANQPAADGGDGSVADRSATGGDRTAEPQPGNAEEETQVIYRAGQARLLFASMRKLWESKKLTYDAVMGVHCDSVSGELTRIRR